MKAAVVGDSFVSYVKGTWVESLADACNLDIIHHKGYAGGCEYFIYEEFERALDKGAEIVIVTHTEPHRLVNPLYKGITPIVATSDFKSDVPDDMRAAAKEYYLHLFHEQYHNTVHNLLIEKMQQMAFQRHVLQVHLQSFVYPVPRNRGLWVLGSMHELAALQGEDYYRDFSLKNHFGENMHDKFSRFIIPHVQKYIDQQPSHTLASFHRDDFK